MILQNKKKVNLSRNERIDSGLAKSIILVLLPLMFLAFTFISAADKVPLGREFPFQPGEKLKYKGTWGIIPAGELTLEVLPQTTINGIKAYHFVMHSKTSKGVDLVYKIRERQDSYVDLAMTRSLFYKIKTESQHPRDGNIKFNWEKMEATYTNFGRSKQPIQIVPGTFDPLALFYALRLMDLKENSVIRIPMTDGNKVSIEVMVDIGKREVIELEGKMYDTIPITPNMEMLDKLDNVVKKSDNPRLKIWVTDDEKKIPIKIRTKVGIISFDFDLVGSS
jgi:hypothetical protein